MTAYTEILNILYQHLPLELCYNVMRYVEHPTARILKEAGFTVKEWDKHLILNIENENFTYNMIYGQLGCDCGWLGGWVDPQERERWMMKNLFLEELMYELKQYKEMSYHFYE